MTVALDSQSNARLGECTRREILRRFGALGLTLASPPVGRASEGSRPKSTAPTLRAKLRINVEQRVGTIDPFLYGHFLEHLGRCVYEGIYDEGSPLSDSDGNRKDVLDAARRLRVTQLRWPGGNFASGYHWQDGVGPPGLTPCAFQPRLVRARIESFRHRRIYCYLPKARCGAISLRQHGDGNPGRGGKLGGILQP